MDISTEDFVHSILDQEPVENAHFDSDKCCDAHNDMFANVWHVLTKEENAYKRVDRIVKWLCIYIIYEGKHFDGMSMPKQAKDKKEFNKQMYHCARRKLWDYMKAQCSEEMLDIQSSRQWQAGKEW